MQMSKLFLTHPITDFCYIYFCKQAIKYRKLIAVTTRELQLGVLCKYWGLGALMLPRTQKACIPHLRGIFKESASLLLRVGN